MAGGQRLGDGGWAKVGEGGPKAQTSSYKIHETRDITYSMVTTV